MQEWLDVKSVIVININRMKGRIHMTMSADGERAFDNIQHSFIIKTLKKWGKEGNYFSVIKAIYKKPTANISGEK